MRPEPWPEELAAQSEAVSLTWIDEELTYLQTAQHARQLQHAAPTPDELDRAADRMAQTPGRGNKKRARFLRVIAAALRSEYGQSRQREREDAEDATNAHDAA